jgi:hypothetical protein
MSKVLNHSLDYKVEFGPALKLVATGAGCVKAKTYKKYSTINDVITEAIAFYILPRGTTLASFSKTVGNKVPLSIIRELFFQCKVFELQATNACVGTLLLVLKEYLAKTHENKVKQTIPASTARRYLTENEEFAIVQIA